MAQRVKNPPAMQETKEMRIESLGWKDPQEEEMATHSSILDWKIPWREKSGGLQSKGVQRVRHDRATKQECFKQSEKSDRYSLPCSFTERVCFSSDFFQNSFLIFDFLKLGYNTEKAMAPHSSTLAWKIPWMEEPGRLRSLGSRRVGYEWATSLSLFTFMHWRRKWQSTLVFLPGESQGQGSLVGCCLWGCTELDMTEAT